MTDLKAMTNEALANLLRLHPNRWSEIQAEFRRRAEREAALVRAARKAKGIAQDEHIPADKAFALIDDRLSAALAAYPEATP